MNDQEVRIPEVLEKLSRYRATGEVEGGDAVMAPAPKGKWVLFDSLEAWLPRIRDAVLEEVRERGKVLRAEAQQSREEKLFGFAEHLDDQAAAIDEACDTALKGESRGD